MYLDVFLKLNRWINRQNDGETKIDEWTTAFR